MNNLGQSFIYGTKNGSPAWFDINTGGTTLGFLNSPGKTQASKKRRRGSGPRESLTASPLTTPAAELEPQSTWIKGSKDGKVCYFNVETKEWRHTPPSKLPGVTTIDVAQNLDVPTAIPFDIEPIAIDTFEIDKIQSDSVEAEEIFRFVMDEEKEKNDMMVDEDSIVKSEFSDVTKPDKAKEQEKKLRNREYANKSRKRNKMRLKAAEEKVKALEEQLRDLREQMNVRTAENETLRNHVAFLQTLVKDKIQDFEGRA